MSGRIEVAIKNAAEQLGEGPHWDGRSKTLLHIDVESGVVSRWDSDTKENKSLKLGGTVGFMVPCKTSGYIVGHNKSLVHLDWDSESTTTVVEVEKDSENNRFNDGKCDAAGRIIAGTMDKAKSTTDFRPEMGSLYQFGTDKSLNVLLKKQNICNGLAWTSDNKTMYYIDSIPRKVWAFNYDLSSGEISNQRVAVDFGKGTEASFGFPDGMTIDTEGKIWVACFDGGKVVRFDPETGKQIQTVEFPVKRITSCCFGGKNLDELYVSSSRFGLSEHQQEEQPLAGSMFKVTELGVKGYAGNDYGGC